MLEQTSVVPVPDGSVIITPAQQYAELQATRKAVEQLVHTIDPALADIRQDITNNRDDIKELRTEVGALKTWRAALSGALVLLSLLVAWGALNLTSIGG